MHIILAYALKYFFKEEKLKHLKLALQSSTRYHWKAHFRLYLYVFITRRSNLDVFHYQPIKPMSPPRVHCPLGGSQFQGTRGALQINELRIRNRQWSDLQAHYPHSFSYRYSPFLNILLNHGYQSLINHNVM